MRKRSCSAILCVGILLGGQATLAESVPSSKNAVPLNSLIADLAKRTGKRFVVDPRVQVDVTLIQQNPVSLSYAELLTVLQVHGFTAAEEGGLVRIVPDANVRSLALPLLGDKEERPDAEYITKIIPVRTTSAAMLVPMLRPLMPMQAHLAASVCTNDLVIVDTVANVRRIEAIVRSLDDGDEPFEARECESAKPK